MGESSKFPIKQPKMQNKGTWSWLACPQFRSFDCFKGWVIDFITCSLNIKVGSDNNNAGADINVMH